MQPLDHLLQTLAAAPADHGLGQLEPAVWRRLEGGPVAAQLDRLLHPVRIATVSGALAIGVVLGGAQAETATSVNEVSLFSARPDLAPSTLLEGRR